MSEEKRYLMRFDSAGRKTVPLYEVLFGYFPDAMVALAEHSYKGNQKHNPGQELHHARTKSMDHENCILRHAANHAGVDGEDLECVALLWRAAALCQENMERRYALTVPYRVVDPRAFPETNSLVGPNGEQAPRQYVEKTEIAKALDAADLRWPTTQRHAPGHDGRDVRVLVDFNHSDGHYYLSGIKQPLGWTPGKEHLVTGVANVTSQRAG